LAVQAETFHWSKFLIYIYDISEIYGIPKTLTGQVVPYS